MTTPPPVSPATELEALTLSEERVEWAVSAQQKTTELSATVRMIQELEAWQTEEIPQLVNSTVHQLRKAGEDLQATIWDEEQRLLESLHQAEQLVAEAEASSGEATHGPEHHESVPPHQFSEELTRRLWELAQIQEEEQDLRYRIAEAGEQLALAQDIVDTAQVILNYYATRAGATNVTRILSRARATERVLDAIIRLGPDPKTKGKYIRKACQVGYATAQDMRSLLAGGWFGPDQVTQNELLLHLTALEESLQRFQDARALIETGEVPPSILPLVADTLTTIRQEIIPEESRWDKLVNEAKQATDELENGFRQMMEKLPTSASLQKPSQVSAHPLDPDDKYALKFLAEHILGEKMSDSEYNVMVRSAGLESLTVDGSGRTRAKIELTVAQFSRTVGTKAEQAGTEVDKVIGDARSALQTLRNQVGAQADTAEQAFRSGFSNFGNILKDVFDDLSSKLTEK
ncbi:hypothetical protein ACIQMR_31600 [Streptomyces sp. NPDC091376]|uniref:hypothetical protein n=1 Tax=Streptomyces sp. NPDC091376 TaxID=3365994 RepID=UPI0038150E3C